MKYISLEVLRVKRQALIDKRTNHLLNQQYGEANKLLPEIQEMNIEFNKLLKERL